jgi:hypothetical protein
MSLIQALGNVSKVRAAPIYPLQFYESAFVRPDADPDRITG